MQRAHQQMNRSDRNTTVDEGGAIKMVSGPPTNKMILVQDSFSVITSQ